MIPEKYQNKYEMIGLMSPFEENHLNVFVCTGPQQGQGFEFNRYVGRVIQVRQKAGSWGSDVVLLQHQNGEISSHENQMFWTVPHRTIFMEKFKETFPEEFDNDTELTIGGNFPATGFIIPFSEDMVDHDAPAQSFSITVTKDLSD